MALYVWFKHEGGGSASSFLLVNGEIDLKLVCQTFGLNEKESVRLGDLVVRIEGDGRVAYDRDEFGGKTKKDAVLVQNVQHPVSSGVKFTFVKSTGGKVSFVMKLPIDIVVVEEQLRKETGWLHNLLKITDEAGTPVSMPDLDQYIKDTVEGKTFAELTFKVEQLDKGFSKFSREEGMAYLKLAPSYKVDQVKAEFAPKKFENLQEKVDVRMKGFENWTIDKLIQHFLDDVKLRMLIFSNFELEGLELTRRELITPLLNLAALLTSKEVELRAEAHVQGSLGHGPIDYTALIEKVQVLLAEAKRHELGKHRGQLYAEMAASREALARTIEPDSKKRKFEELDELLEGVSTTGVLTDATTWKFTRYINDDGQPKMIESEEMRISLKTASDAALREEVMNVVGVLTAAFEKHIQEYDHIIEQRMNKQKRRKTEEKGTEGSKASAPCQKKQEGEKREQDV